MGRVMGRVMGQSRGQSLTQRRLRQLHDSASLPPSLCMTKAAALALPAAQIYQAGEERRRQAEYRANVKGKSPDMWARQSPDMRAESWTESWADTRDRAVGRVTHGQRGQSQTCGHVRVQTCVQSHAQRRGQTCGTEP